MSDLISRKALLEALVKAEEECEEAMTVPGFATAVYAIRNQPTAYDPDKVVEQLEALPNINQNYHSSTELIDREDAVEIVKEGGIDE